MKSSQGYAAFGEDVFDDNLLLMHVIIVAYNKFVPVGTWNHARAFSVASGQAAEVRHVTEGEPAASGGLFGKKLCVDLSVHAAVISDVMELPARHLGNGLDDVQTLVVAVRTFASNACAARVSVACGKRVHDLFETVHVVLGLLSVGVPLMSEDLPVA